MTESERNKAFKQARAAELKLRGALLAKTREDVIQLLNDALTEIKQLLATFPTEYESYKLPLLQKQIEQTLETFINNSAEVLAEGTAQAWSGGQSLVTAPLEAAGISITASLPAMDTRTLMAIRYFMTDRIKDVGKAAISKINSQLGLVLIGAQSPGEAVGTITTILSEESRDRAITIMRTGIGSVYAVATQQCMEQTAKIVPGLQKQWRRSEKLHSRLNHDLIDGQIKPVDEPFELTAKDGTALRMMHPHDPTAPAGEVINCGCISIPWKVDWKALHPGRKPFSQLELQHDPSGIKRALNDGITNPVRITEAFNPSQARDTNGKWAKGGGISSVAEISAFLDGKSHKNIVVASVPLDIKAKLGANSDYVLLSRYTVDKQKKHPEITAESYSKLQYLLDHGERLYDAKHHVTVIQHSSHPYVAVLKSTQSRHEVYLQSFRRSDAKNVASLKRRGAGGR